jgi:hypothetical protein
MFTKRRLAEQSNMKDKTLFGICRRAAFFSKNHAKAKAVKDSKSKIELTWRKFRIITVKTHPLAAPQRSNQ